MILSINRSKLRGFTLIELLVCIAIIAILAAILIPAISRVRSSANSVKCVSNLRQVGVSMHMFVTENKGLLPQPLDNILPDIDEPVSWMIVLNEYMELRFPDVNEDTYLLCPEAHATYPSGNARRTYSMNAAGTGGTDAIRFASFEKPADTILLFDGVSSGATDANAAFGAGSYLTSIDWRHGNRANLLMMDGHINSIQADDLDRLDRYVKNFMIR